MKSYFPDVAFITPSNLYTLAFVPSAKPGSITIGFEVVILSAIIDVPDNSKS